MPKEDLRFHRGFFDNIKIKRFKNEFSKVASPDCPLCGLMKVWIYAAMHKSEGVFAREYQQDFELMADWGGPPGLFSEMLLKHKLIVETPEGYAINDWEEHQPWVAKSKQRSAAGKANAGERWSKKNANLKIGNANSKIGNAKKEKADANSKIGNAPNPIPIPIPKPNPKPNPMPDSDDYPRDVVKWFNEIVAPPFTPIRAFTRNVRWQIMKALEILREIHGPDKVDGNEVLIFRQYLLRAKEQYEHGQVPCKWGISNLCKEDNITKIIDGVFAPKEGAEEWAKEAKERLQ
tara:strand:- start:15056 stop:15928 length:873 start_codon:yes stop_codon:yes gene_type:complete